MEPEPSDLTKAADKGFAASLSDHLKDSLWCMRSSIPDADRVVPRPRVDPAFDHRHRVDIIYARSNTAFVNFLSSTKHASDTTQEDLKEWVSSCNQKHDDLVIIMRSQPKTTFRWIFFKDTGTKINMNPIIFVKVTSNSIKSLFL